MGAETAIGSKLPANLIAFLDFVPSSPVKCKPHVVLI